jgi:predicted glycosyltransferase
MTGSEGKRVLFYVQHLLGSGHLRRAATLCRAMAASGLDVTLVSGGLPLPHLDPGGAKFEQLPPVRATDSSFSALVDEHGAPIDERWKQARAAALLELFHRLRPHGLIFEMFPFGRRQMRFELLPLLETARSANPRPLILSSVRDVLVAKKKPERLAEMADLAERDFDAVLVHGDPKVIAFEQSFPLASRIAAKLRYTGYVAEAHSPPLPAAQRAGVVVSAGGGPVGLRLMRTALEARAKSRLAAAPWRLLVAHAIGDEDFAALQALAQATPGVAVERARADFRDLLAACTLSISQAGYNTVMEVLGAGARAVFAPFAEGAETEQLVRAEALAERGLCHLVPPQSLNAHALAEAIDGALDGPPPDIGAIDRGGAPNAARLLKGMLSTPQACTSP